MNKKFVRLVEVGAATALLIAAIIVTPGLITSSIGRHAEAKGEEILAYQWYEASKNRSFSRDLHLSRSKILYELQQYEKAKSAIHDYLNINAEDYRGYYLLGQVEHALGNKDTALEAFKTAYMLGKYNDISIATSIVKTMIELGQQEELEQKREEYDSLLEEYINAIAVNSHFIALSENVESAVELANIFAKLYPKEAPIYEVQAAKADHHAAIERERIRSRKPGMLW